MLMSNTMAAASVTRARLPSSSGLAELVARYEHIICNTLNHCSSRTLQSTRTVAWVRATACFQMHAAYIIIGI